MTNRKIDIEYYCNDEAAIIYDSVDSNTDFSQLKCKNDINHVINPMTIRVISDIYTNIINDPAINELFDLTQLDYANLSASDKKICEIIKTVINCLVLKGIIKLT